MGKIDINDPTGTLYMTKRGVWLRKISGCEDYDGALIHCVHDNGEYDGPIWINPADGEVVGAPSSKCGDLALTGEKKLPGSPINTNVRIISPRVEIIFSKLPDCYPEDIINEMELDAMREVLDSLNKDYLMTTLVLSARKHESIFIYELTNASVIEGGWLLEYEYKYSAS